MLRLCTIARMDSPRARTAELPLCVVDGVIPRLVGVQILPGTFFVLVLAGTAFPTDFKVPVGLGFFRFPEESGDFLWECGFLVMLVDVVRVFESTVLGSSIDTGDVRASSVSPIRSNLHRAG